MSAHRGAYTVFQNEGTTVDRRRDVTLIELKARCDAVDSIATYF